MNIGIIGHGTVGSAISHGFKVKTKATLRIHDIISSRSTHSLSQVCKNSDFIFIAVPTPENTNGSINLKFVDDIFNKISHETIKENSIIILKSTVTPGTTRLLKRKHQKLNILFNPEFLTARNAKKEFLNPSEIIIGAKNSDDPAIEKALEMYKTLITKNVFILKTSFETAEFIKYMRNCLFATKISFINEMHDLSQHCHLNWDHILQGFTSDFRINAYGTQVPGHDGHYGFGGACLPKDIKAMIRFSESIGKDPVLLKSVWNRNKLDRNIKEEDAS